MLEINKFDRIIVANWKLNGSIHFIEQYLQELNCSKLENSNNCGIICTPSVYFHKLVGRLNPLFLGGQDCSNYSEGAYTGEVSATMLKDASCQFCIIGHSERREFFKETNADLAQKVTRALANNLKVIFCCGERLNQREDESHFNWIKQQLSEGIFHLDSTDFANIVIAYEPIWAIGTGKTPTVNEIEDINLYIKKIITKINLSYEKTSILYGGSVNKHNSLVFLDNKNIDGLLIGGASLNLNTFFSILTYK